MGVRTGREEQSGARRALSRSLALSLALSRSLTRFLPLSLSLALALSRSLSLTLSRALSLSLTHSLTLSHYRAFSLAFSPARHGRWSKSYPTAYINQTVLESQLPHKTVNLLSNPTQNRQLTILISDSKRRFDRW